MLAPDDANWLRPIPLFPLPNCVLLPGAVLPLHIFEPRYLEMMQDVVARDAADRLLAMALLREGWEPHYYTRRAPIHETVCVGRVIQYEELPDGKFNLLLLGLQRATVIEEIGNQLYRQALLAPVDDGVIGPHEEQLRQVLYHLVVEFSRRTGALSDQIVQGLFRTAPNTVVLIDVLVHYVVPAAQTLVKQGFLEERQPHARARKLIAHLQEVVGAGKSSEDPIWPPRVNPN